MKKYDPKAFVEAWVEAHQLNQGYDYIAKKLGITKQAVANRALQLKVRGVELPNLKNVVYTKEQLEELNQIIEDAEIA